MGKCNYCSKDYVAVDSDAGTYLEHYCSEECDIAYAGLYERALNEFIAWLNIERPSITSLTQIDLETSISFMEHVWETGISASTYNDKRNALGHITKKLANRFGIDHNSWPLTERKRGVKQKRLPLSNLVLKYFVLFLSVYFFIISKELF